MSLSWTPLFISPHLLGRPFPRHCLHLFFEAWILPALQSLSASCIGLTKKFVWVFYSILWTNPNDSSAWVSPFSKFLHFVFGNLLCLSFTVIFSWVYVIVWGFPGGSDSKESACSAGDPGSVPGSGRSPGEGHGNPLLYIRVWRIPWTEEPGKLQFIGSQRTGNDWASNNISLLQGRERVMRSKEMLMRCVSPVLTMPCGS